MSVCTESIENPETLLHVIFTTGNSCATVHHLLHLASNVKHVYLVDIIKSNKEGTFGAHV